jgi:hypothetical protein
MFDPNLVQKVFFYGYGGSTQVGSLSVIVLPAASKKVILSYPPSIKVRVAKWVKTNFVKAILLIHEIETRL